jgi:hypothetical protein
MFGKGDVYPITASFFEEIIATEILKGAQKRVGEGFRGEGFS